MEPKHPIHYNFDPSHYPVSWSSEESAANTQQYYRRPFVFFPPPFIIPIVPFPPFFSRFPYRRRFFW